MTFELSPAWRDFAAYFGLVMVMTVPFWLAGYLVESGLVPGLSVAALAVVVPMIGASIFLLVPAQIKGMPAPKCQPWKIRA